MARLFIGESRDNAQYILSLLHSHEFGLLESEIADLLGWERRRVNNYLRELERQGRAYRDGHYWYAE